MNPDLVETPFLISYLNKYTRINRADLKLTKKQQESVFKLLETKFSQPDAIMAFNRDKNCQELISVARFFTKSIPKATNIAITKFLEQG